MLVLPLRKARAVLQEGRAHGQAHVAAEAQHPCGLGRLPGTPGSPCPALLPALLCETAGGCAAAHMWPG